MVELRTVAKIGTWNLSNWLRVILCHLGLQMPLKTCQYMECVLVVGRLIQHNWIAVEERRILPSNTDSATMSVMEVQEPELTDSTAVFH
jgi:hypothetical protein